MRSFSELAERLSLLTANFLCRTVHILQFVPPFSYLFINCPPTIAYCLMHYWSLRLPRHTRNIVSHCSLIEFIFSAFLTQRMLHANRRIYSECKRPDSSLVIVANLSWPLSRFLGWQMFMEDSKLRLRIRYDRLILEDLTWDQNSWRLVSLSTGLTYIFCLLQTKENSRTVSGIETTIDF